MTFFVFFLPDFVALVIVIFAVASFRYIYRRCVTKAIGSIYPGSTGITCMWCIFIKPFFEPSDIH